MSSSGLLRTINSARLAPYVRATNGSDSRVEALYRWNTRLGLALFDDIGIVEVALRNAMSIQLRRVHGTNWFDNWALFDDDTMSLIQSAKAQFGFENVKADDDVKHGKLVATLMFGFWVKLLGKGSYQGITRKTLAPAKRRVIYDTVLWRACLHEGFAGAGEMDRAKVERPAAVVRAIRNRVAHHESVIWGIPLPGQIRADGTSRRLSVAESYERVTELAGLIDPRLADWLAVNSSIPSLLASRPESSVTSLLL